MDSTKHKSWTRVIVLTIATLFCLSLFCPAQSYAGQKKRGKGYSKGYKQGKKHHKKYRNKSRESKYDGAKSYDAPTRRSPGYGGDQAYDARGYDQTQERLDRRRRQEYERAMQRYRQEIERIDRDFRLEQERNARQMRQNLQRERRGNLDGQESRVQE